MTDDNQNQTDEKEATTNHYEEKRRRRINRLKQRANNAKQQADSTREQASKMASAIPLGQPILIGHHSEKRDRNYRKKIDNKFRRAHEQQQQAVELEGRAIAAENNRAISSDDPEAVRKLRRKLTDCEALQDAMKVVNKALKKAKLTEKTTFPREQLLELLSSTVPKYPGQEGLLAMLYSSFQFGWNGVLFPSYKLRNNNAEIRRLKKRIEQLSFESEQISTERDKGICQVVEDVGDNRIRLIFSGKPPAETRALLKQNGFRWSPRNLAWQRHLNNAGKYAASYVISKLKE